MNILVVEDEPKIGEYLKKGLTESGYIVTLATLTIPSYERGVARLLRYDRHP